jgi:hypothetical protein
MCFITPSKKKVEHKRFISSLEIILSLDPLDQSQPGYQKPLPESMVEERDLEEIKTRGRSSRRKVIAAGSTDEQAEERDPEEGRNRDSSKSRKRSNKSFSTLIHTLFLYNKSFHI